MRFAIMKSGTVPRATRERLGDYGQLFTKLLSEPGQTWDVHDVEHDQFPESLDGYDGIVLTGGPVSAYDDLPWVHELLKLTKAAHGKGIPILGICLGAQMAAQALGGEAGLNPLGWDIGVVSLNLNGNQGRIPGLAQAPEPLTILQSHQDIVTRLPEGALSLASSPRTPHEVFTLGDRVLCLQGHPELDEEALRNLIEKRLSKNLLPEDRAREGLDSLKTPPSRKFYEKWLRAFLREGRVQAAA